eukprot:12769330-Alexandrium_andersonii.AAC.1
MKLHKVQGRSPGAGSWTPSQGTRRTRGPGTRSCTGRRSGSDNARSCETGHEVQGHEEYDVLG